MRRDAAEPVDLVPQVLIVRVGERAKPARRSRPLDIDPRGLTGPVEIGSGFSSSALMTLKMALLAPIPSTRIATALNPQCLASTRTPYRRSENMVTPSRRLDWEKNSGVAHPGERGTPGFRHEATIDSRRRRSTTPKSGGSPAWHGRRSLLLVPVRLSS